MSKLTVGELIYELERFDKDKPIRISVIYDDCEHIQYLKDLYEFDSNGGGWVTLTGGE